MPRNQQAPGDRLSAIELLLLWEGRVTRGRLLELFNVHETMASRDIAAFRKQHPEACVPLPEAKAYERTPWMKPVRTEGHFADYQQLIGAWHGSIIAAGVPLVSANVDVTNIAFNDYAAIHGAIRDGRAVQLTYRSLRNPTAHSRTMRPHTLIQAGPRWHVRGWCTKAAQFRDFNLGRISNAVIVDADNMPDMAEDADWNTLTTVRLVPHCDLDSKQKKLVRDEYMRGATALRYDAKLPMVRYLAQAHRAAIDAERQIPPDYLLMVSDPETLPRATDWNR